jgi:hypothetical protein
MHRRVDDARTIAEKRRKFTACLVGDFGGTVRRTV